MKRARPKTKNEAGIAMLMALVTLVILTVLAGELVYQSSVYSGIVFRSRDQLQATLLARSGLRLALLQLRATTKAKAKAKSMGLGSDTSMVDQIWQTPLILPPPAPPDLGPAEKENFDTFQKALGLTGSLTATILGENSRISVNQLVWLSSNPNAPKTAQQAGINGVTGGNVVGMQGPTDPRQAAEAQQQQQQAQQKALQTLRQGFSDTLQAILDKKRQDDDKFRDKYASATGAILIGNLAAFMDPNTQTDGDNRNKEDYYASFQPSPYEPKNAPLVSESEVFMVKGFDDTLAKILTDNFTTGPTGGFDVNKASPQLLQGLIPELTPDAVDKVIKRRDDPVLGQFKTADDFWNFLKTLGNFDDAKKNLTDRGITVLGDETSYRVLITATSGSATKNWVAEIGPLPPADPNATATQPQAGTQPGAQQPTVTQPGATPNSSTSTSTSTATDLDSTSVLYLKAD